MQGPGDRLPRLLNEAMQRIIIESLKEGKIACRNGKLGNCAFCTADKRHKMSQVCVNTKL